MVGPGCAVGAGAAVLTKAMFDLTAQTHATRRGHGPAVRVHTPDMTCTYNVNGDSRVYSRMHWRRIGATQLDDTDSLVGIIPTSDDPRFDRDVADGLLLVCEDTAEQLDQLFRLGAEGSPLAADSELPVFGASRWDDEESFNILTPDHVGRAARFLVASDVDTWLDDHRRELALMDEESEVDLLEDARRLKEFFRGAAETGDAMVRYYTF